MRTWTTANLPEREQFSYWREVICEAFTTLIPAANARSAFESEVVQRDLGGVLLSDTRSMAQTIARGPREIALDATPRFFINYQVAGTCVIRQDSRETLMRPGDFYLVDTLRPYTQNYSDWHVLCVSIPRHLLAPFLIDPTRVTAMRLSASDGGLGAVAGSFILSLQNCAESADLVARELLATSLINVIAVALGGTTEAQERARTPLAQCLLNAIKEHIKRNSANPDLSVSTVARQFHISPRYVHKLFEGSQQTFAQLVLEERLSRAASALTRRDNSVAVSEIAYNAGFGDLSYFCRAFRKRFGVSARAYRLGQTPAAIDLK